MSTETPRTDSIYCLTPRDDRGEIWQQAMQQVPQPCACRFEWRPTPDFSGEPPKQLDECGFHATARTAAQQEIERLREALSGLLGLLHLLYSRPDAPPWLKEIALTNHRAQDARRALGEEG